MPPGNSFHRQHSLVEVTYGLYFGMDFVPRVIPASGFPPGRVDSTGAFDGFIQCIGHGINGRREWRLTLSGRVDFIFYKMCINEPEC